jgi:5-methylcytosine-specific restriction protein A
MVLTGEKLKEIWNIDVIDALYRETGDWYHLLKNFPAALFDKNGYIIFHTEEEYKNNSYLQIGKELHIPKGISNISGYIKIIENGNIQEISQEINIEAAEDMDKPPPNGEMINSRKVVSIERLIRNTNVTNWVKKLYNNCCQICGTTIKLSDNENYSEGHHIIPLSHKGPDIIHNLICVCPNHHVQLDYGAIKIDKTRLKIKNGHNIYDEYIKYHNEMIYK